jgi:hypothetical protein
VALSLIGSLGCLVPTLFVVAAFTFAGARFGRPAAVVVFGAAGGCVTWSLVPSQWHRARHLLTATLAVSIGWVGLACADAAPPTHGRLRHETSRVVPDDWELVDEATFGNVLCFDECPEISRTYRAGTDVETTLHALTSALPDAVCRRPAPTSDVRACEAVAGGLELRVEIVDAPGGGSTVTVGARS